MAFGLVTRGCRPPWCCTPALSHMLWLLQLQHWMRCAFRCFTQGSIHSYVPLVRFKSGDARTCISRSMSLCRLNVLEQPPRESSLKYQTRCVAAFSGSPSFALGSVEGRVAMEILDPSPQAQEAKYAFKVGDCVWARTAALLNVGSASSYAVQIAALHSSNRTQQSPALAEQMDRQRDRADARQQHSSSM